MVIFCIKLIMKKLATSIIPVYPNTKKFTYIVTSDTYKIWHFSFTSDKLEVYVDYFEKKYFFQKSCF